MNKAKIAFFILLIIFMFLLGYTLGSYFTYKHFDTLINLSVDGAIHSFK